VSGRRVGISTKGWLRGDLCDDGTVLNIYIYICTYMLKIELITLHMLTMYSLLPPSPCTLIEVASQECTCDKMAWNYFCQLFEYLCIHEQKIQRSKLFSSYILKLLLNSFFFSLVMLMTSTISSWFLYFFRSYALFVQSQIFL
jgi:hypothetical protein